MACVLPDVREEEGLKSNSRRKRRDVVKRQTRETKNKFYDQSNVDGAFRLHNVRTLIM